MQENKKNTTHFGYKEVPLNEKASLVAEVFRSVAPKYDLMNDLMSFGLHRFWKRFAIEQAEIRPGDVVLDIACGTGDLAKMLAKKVGDHGKVILTDINETMLQTGRERLEDKGMVGNISYVQANAENLPFTANFFDCITIAFGLRNVTHKAAALKSIYRILKPGGKLLILEFSHTQSPLLKKMYDFYSFNVIPKLGEWVANDKDSYQYLVESIRMHPDQETLKSMMNEAGFEDAAFFNLNGGIVALHTGYKY